jgi:hypothetical protein
MNIYVGPPRAMTRLTLRLVPLTPVHIGDGTEMRLDEYLLEEPKREAGQEQHDDAGGEAAQSSSAGLAMLCRFDQMQAIRQMTTAERAAFQRALDAGKLGDAGDLLRKAGSRAIVERIPLSNIAKKELKEAFQHPMLRSGQVKPFVRSGGRPYIPGSSIKGALRTALASAALPRGTRPDDGWTHEEALAAAFGLDPSGTETDPLRFLRVSDAFLPEGATLIDKAEVIKPGGETATSRRGGGGIQMHYERSLALTDGPSGPVFTVIMDVDSRAQEERFVSRREARFRPQEVLARCLGFHAKLFNGEMHRFFSKGTQTLLMRTLLAHRHSDGRPPFKDGKWDPDFLLLRLGRFGHFESKSLEGVRRGHFPQARHSADENRKPNAWGSTRTVIRDAQDNPIPFGWVIGWVVKEERLCP